MDYVGRSTQLTFDPMDETMSVSVEIIDDDIAELPERFAVVLVTSMPNVLIGEPPQVVVAILDDDSKTLNMTATQFSRMLLN